MDNLEAKSELKISKYGEGLEIEIPKEIRVRFGVK
jgi:hypothetical protein